MSYRVFISYCDEDSEVAQQVCFGLEATGIDCWMAPRDVRPGENWGRSIIKALGEARVMVLIFSRHTNESRHVNNEIERAVSHRLPIIPFRIEQVQPSEDLEFFISNCHWLDAIQAPLEPKIAELSAAVCGIVGTEDSSPTAATETPAPVSAPDTAVHGPPPGEPEEFAFHHFVVMRKDDGAPWEIGRGAMGVTYKAMDSRLRRKVALKVVSPELLATGSAREKFLLEAQATAALQHPNIASIYYFGERNGACFYAMEFVDGPTLESLVKQRGPLAAEDALNIASQAAAALGAAHEAGMVHRDIKPSNIMVVSKPDGTMSVRVIDFGLAAAAGGESQDFEGTPLYASPEQLDQGALDARSDIYSLGATLYFSLAGHPPYQGSYAQIAERQIMEPFPAHALQFQPPEILRLVARMMDRDPANRPQSGGDARSEIEVIQRDFHRAGKQTALEWMGAQFGAIDRVGPIEGGSLYRVSAQTGAEELAVLCFDTSARSLAVADRVREVAPVIKSLAAPAVRGVRDTADVKDGFVLVTEWLTGTRLLSVLRVRRVLPATEARHVLAPLAQALDEAAARGLPLPQLTLREILLQPGEKPETPLDQWPGLRPVLDLLPVGEATEADVNTTITRSSALAQVTSYEASERSPAALIGSLAYEVLGGMSSPGLGPYVPLAELSQDANAALREIFQNPQSAGGAGDLVAKILPAKSSAAMPATTSALLAGAKRGKFKRRADVVPPATTTPAPTTPDTAAARPKRGLLVVAAAAGLLLLAGLAFLFASRSLGGKAETDLPAGITSDTPAADSPAKATAPATASPEDAMQKARDLENAQDFVGALIVYKDILAREPNNKEIRTRAENVIARLEEKSALFAGNQDLREALEQLSKADVPRASTLLAEFLQEDNPWQSFALYQKAAELGDRHGMVMTGLAMASGNGTDQSEEKAAVWLKRASDLGYPFGMRCYAEVLYHGQGIDQNHEEAARLYSAAASLGDIPSKSKLGELYRRGIGVPEMDYTAALRLFQEASDEGFLEARANLGVMLMLGEGISPDPVKAVALWKDGSEREHAYSTFLYAVALLNGATAPPQPEAAREAFRKAARLGDADAVNWCMENNIDVFDLSSGGTGDNRQ